MHSGQVDQQQEQADHLGEGGRTEEPESHDQAPVVEPGRTIIRTTTTAHSRLKIPVTMPSRAAVRAPTAAAPAGKPSAADPAATGAAAEPIVAEAGWAAAVARTAAWPGRTRKASTAAAA